MSVIATCFAIDGYLIQAIVLETENQQSTAFVFNINGFLWVATIYARYRHAEYFASWRAQLAGGENLVSQISVVVNLIKFQVNFWWTFAALDKNNLIHCNFSTKQKAAKSGFYCDSVDFIVHLC